MQLIGLTYTGDNISHRHYSHSHELPPYCINHVGDQFIVYTCKFQCK